MSRATDFPEQDVGGGDDLPTYENLAQAHGPNSRYALLTTHLATPVIHPFPCREDSADGEAG